MPKLFAYRAGAPHGQKEWPSRTYLITVAAGPSNKDRTGRTPAEAASRAGGAITASLKLTGSMPVRIGHTTGFFVPNKTIALV